MPETEAKSTVGIFRRTALIEPLMVKDFRFLWIGETVSVLGDQFYLVALPLLSLQLINSGLVMGTVLMAAAIPRAALMLAGGVAADRFSPRTVMLSSNIARCLIVFIMMVLVHAHAMHMWHLYALAAAFGVFDALFYPAYAAILPALLPSDQLNAGNSLMQGSVQLTGLIGPAAAGLIISSTGLAAVFGFDGLSFIVSVIMLMFISKARPAVERKTTLLSSIQEGITFAVRHPLIRAILVAYAIMNFFLTGPFIVGAPLLANLRFGGAKALGLLYSAFGAGALAGTIAAGHYQRDRRLGPQLVFVYVAAGVTMIALALIWRLWISAGVLLMLGVIVGYNNVRMQSFLQRVTEPDKMGRIMSLIMVCANGLLPLSYLLSGVISRIGVVALFVVSGVTVIAGAATLFRSPEFWHKR
jgi:MFS family permease